MNRSDRKTRREQVKTGNLGEGRISNLTFINMVMIGVLAALFIAASLIVPNFFNINTVSNLIAQQAEIIIIGIGIAFLLIAGYFDMSVGGIIAMAAVLCAYFSQADRGIEGLSSGLGMNYWLASVLTILICSIIGLINAFLVVRMKIASVIATLATMALARGWRLLWLKEHSAMPACLLSLSRLASIPLCNHKCGGADNGCAGYSCPDN